MKSKKPKYGDFGKKHGDIGKIVEGAGVHILIFILPFILLIWVISFIGEKLAISHEKRSKK